MLEIDGDLPVVFGHEVHGFAGRKTGTEGTGETELQEEQRNGERTEKNVVFSARLRYSIPRCDSVRPAPSVSVRTLPRAYTSWPAI